jgi:hypothetical protein
MISSGEVQNPPAPGFNFKSLVILNTGIFKTFHAAAVAGCG